ncbi:MAG: proton-conducting transporter membrane subunit, partial [Planctomycetales bacterium]
RLLAYSTIAHAGYMMMAAAAAVQLIGAADPDRARGAVASLVVYVTTYLFMSLGAFAVVAFLRNELRSEEIKDYAGLIHQCPGLVVCMGIILFSLIGLPPFAGFVAKFSIFASLYDAGLHTLLLVGALNTVVSLFYYLRVIKVMTIDPEPEERPPVSLGLFSGPGGYVLLVTLPVALGILGWDGLREWSIAAASNLFQ